MNTNHSDQAPTAEKWKELMKNILNLELKHTTQDEKLKRLSEELKNQERMNQELYETIVKEFKNKYRNKYKSINKSNLF